MEFWKIFSTAVITAMASNLFGYFKDRKFATSKYTEDTLIKIYVPIYKILTERIVPGDGYDGILESQLIEINKIIGNHPQLTDPRLSNIVYSYIEDIYHNSNPNYNPQTSEPIIYDLDRELLDYILISFNKTRRSLGLPSDITYAYPLLLNLIKWKSIFTKRRIRRIIKRREKKKESND